MNSISIEAAQSRVIDLLVDRYGSAAENVGVDDRLPDALPNFDSLAVMNIVNDVEQAFAVDIDFVTDDVRYWFATVSRIAELICRKAEDATRG